MNQSNRSRLNLILAISLSLLLFHLAALKLHLYWTTWWMDIINHFLGGAVVALIFYTGLSSVGKYRRDLSFWMLFMLVLAVGVLWEVFELTFGLTFVSQHQYLLDTVLDIIMDMLGMIAVYCYFISRQDQVQ